MDGVCSPLDAEAKVGGRAKGIVSDYLVTDDEIKAAIRSEAICSGHLGEFARNLAGKAAVCEKLIKVSGPTINGERIESHLEALLKKVDSNDLESLARQPLERLVHLATLETAFEEIASRALTPESVRSCVVANRIDWIKLGIDYLVFDEEPAAREGALCVREDQMSMAEIAAAAQKSLAHTTVYNEDLGAELKSQFLACTQGELLGPLRWEGHYALCLVIHKTLPGDADPQVRAKAEQKILETLLKHEINDRGRWHFALGSSL